MEYRALIPALLLSASPLMSAHAQSATERAFLERTSLQAADEKCGYFTDLEQVALTSGQLQARGALLRSGFTAYAIDTAADEVARFANSRPCGDADFIASVRHLKNAFEAFIGTMVQDYPGRDRGWYASRSRWDTWRVVQNGSTDDYAFEFGLLAPIIEDPDEFSATFARPLEVPVREDPYTLAVDLLLQEDEPEPSIARILLRDPYKASEPWLGSVFTDEPGPPPRAQTKAYWPTGRDIIFDEEKETKHIRFTFSPETTAAIERMDPREIFEIVVFPNARDADAEPRYLTVEIGDFAAAHAFTKLPPL